jgi:hypothetical protein
VIFGLLSCAAPRSVVKKPVPTPSPPAENDDKVRIYDPKTDSYILVPRSAIKVDTIEWTSDPTPPIVTDGNIASDQTPLKNHFDIALLMPFNAKEAELYGEQQDPKLIRFIQYNAGIEMAMAEIDSMGLPFTFHSYDVDDSSRPVEELLRKPEVLKADVIVGPYDKEDIEATAAFGLKHEIMVVSPWLPAFTSTTDNPFFIQLFPGLASHAAAIIDFIKNDMSSKKVYVVARNNPAEINRIQLFSKNQNLKVNELIIKDSSPDLMNTDLNALLSDESGTIFILPYFAKSDEAFVNSFLRKLHADKGTREAVVFGLPQWTGFTNLTANYMESLSVHLSISTFIDVSNPQYPSFRARFLAKFHTVPDIQAFQGYDLVKWLASSLSNKGQEGLIGYMDSTSYGLASGFDIKPVFRMDSAPPTEMKVPAYYENKKIRIIKYVEQDYILVK